MTFTKTAIDDVVIIEPIYHGDNRGYFAETFRCDLLEQYTQKKLNFCQDNESSSSFGVLRGLHYQLPPFAQTKLVRVVEGRVYDVAVDIRKNSPTFGKSVCVELSSENKRQLFIPRGFAHGFVVVSPKCVFAYKVDNYYSASHDRGIAFDDPALGIDWKVDAQNLSISKKDSAQPMFCDAELFDFAVDYYK